MARYKINIEYDGTNLVGWQKQKNGISIQEIIENSLYKLTSEKIKIQMNKYVWNLFSLPFRLLPCFS